MCVSLDGCKDINKNIHTRYIRVTISLMRRRRGQKYNFGKSTCNHYRLHWCQSPATLAMCINGRIVRTSPVFCTPFARIGIFPRRFRENPFPVSYDVAIFASVKKQHKV